MFLPDRFASANACLILFAVAVHHSYGSCSDQSGCGVERFNGVVALLTTRPSRSMISAFAPVVERSIPSKCVMGRNNGIKGRNGPCLFVPFVLFCGYA